MNSLKEKFLQLDKKKKTAIICGSVAAIILIVVIIVVISLNGKKKNQNPLQLQHQNLHRHRLQQQSLHLYRLQFRLNFNAWQAYNPDVYAWIYVPGTSVNYPILQSATDNSYYLDYNIDGTKGYPGCVYSENINSKDFSDMHTVLYGHNMHAGYTYKGLDGTMFRTLHKFEDADFFNANRYFYIYTNNQVLTYEIFAAYTYDDRHLLNNYALDQDGVFQEYINNIYLQKDGTYKRRCCKSNSSGQNCHNGNMYRKFCNKNGLLLVF